jgi:photosystem II stability/assembly factor-like uncharacterized protein
MEAAEPGTLSRRRRRAVALAAGAAIVVLVAGVIYLRGSSPAPMSPLASPLVNPDDTSIDWVIYDFPSPTVAWALTFPRDRPAAFSVSRTIDGGKHWQQRHAGTVGLKGNFPVHVRFADEKRGFVAPGDGRLLRTSDGGASWKSLKLPEPANSNLSFRDDKRGWLMAPMNRLASEPIHLHATDDAGETWHQLSDPPLDSAIFAFRRTSEVWMASRGAQSARAYRSIDGGLSWQAVDIPLEKASAGPGPWSTLVTLLPGNGVIVSAFCQCPGPVETNFTSFDGGVTWQVLPPAPGRGQRFVAYSDDVNWWTIYGTIYRSTDAGQTWHRASDNLVALNWQFQPRAIDQKHAWAQIEVKDGYGLATTADAGLHWTRVKVPQFT